MNLPESIRKKAGLIHMWLLAAPVASYRREPQNHDAMVYLVAQDLAKLYTGVEIRFNDRQGRPRTVLVRALLTSHSTDAPATPKLNKTRYPGSLRGGCFTCKIIGVSSSSTVYYPTRGDVADLRTFVDSFNLELYSGVSPFLATLDYYDPTLTTDYCVSGHGVENISKDFWSTLLNTLHRRQENPPEWTIEKHRAQAFEQTLDQVITPTDFELRSCFHYKPPPSSHKGRKMVDYLHYHSTTLAELVLHLTYTSRNSVYKDAVVHLFRCIRYYTQESFVRSELEEMDSITQDVCDEIENLFPLNMNSGLVHYIRHWGSRFAEADRSVAVILTLVSVLAGGQETLLPWNNDQSCP